MTAKRALLVLGLSILLSDAAGVAFYFTCPSLATMPRVLSVMSVWFACSFLSCTIYLILQIAESIRKIKDPSCLTRLRPGQIEINARTIGWKDEKLGHDGIDTLGQVFCHDIPTFLQTYAKHKRVQYSLALLQKLSPLSRIFFFSRTTKIIALTLCVGLSFGTAIAFHPKGPSVTNLPKALSTPLVACLCFLGVMAVFGLLGILRFRTAYASRCIKYKKSGARFNSKLKSMTVFGYELTKASCPEWSQRPDGAKGEICQTIDRLFSTRSAIRYVSQTNEPFAPKNFSTSDMTASEERKAFKYSVADEYKAKNMLKEAICTEIEAVSKNLLLQDS